MDIVQLAAAIFIFGLAFWALERASRSRPNRRGSVARWKWC